ncbi:hypothetical protein HMPREF1529_01396 [Microbacterium sp. oral taxon 186 str. F0373]|jgi:putative protein-disulfide isomerase|uniref:hypothetical protein n=1 Tax=Microbacterium sp. oral taxon 186 TaxID=712383 RepID=UPI0002587673|nr:hypothetical protein [Microbacterium sp. oral taxon 186]EIC08397.1 thioredoxin [Microbacterium laevaniformans OR221]EPD84790.1 hypothetical protein HMPREF1529_01396 [Microbacterium sp. oral taxon 186 str. F0373]
MDSDAAARGLAALRAVAGPGRDLELAAAMQAAFYRDGKSLSEVSTYADIAVAHGLDAQDVVAHLSDPQVAELARREQDELAEAGTHSYPMLLLRRGDGFVQVGGPTSSASQLRAHIDAA